MAASATVLPGNSRSGARQRVAILGAGVSGQAAKRLVLALGGEVCVFDQAGRGDRRQFDAQCLHAFDCFIFSPGFASQHPWRVLVADARRPCYSELAYAAQHWRGQLLAVTGTNGKTSLTALLCAALKRAGHPAIAAGNIGAPLSDAVCQAINQRGAYAVCEISSFQAELSDGLCLDALLWTNFAEDHLDRYASQADYFAAKQKLCSCLSETAPLVVGGSVVAFEPALAKRPQCQVVAPEVSALAGLERCSPFAQMPQAENLALAAALWRAFELPLAALVQCANTFELAAHRLRVVSTWDGVQFWDDSKATNFHAALAAIDALAAQRLPLFWIGGGSPKGGDLDAFAAALAGKVKAAFVYGAVAPLLAAKLRERQVRVARFEDFADAVRAASHAALPCAAAVVLLSPGFASLDQFSSYAERGKSFISTVLGLKEQVRPS